MIKQLLLILPLLLGANEDFISHYEYGEMLYGNPRGVGCAQCHGDNGAGKTIVEFEDAHGKHAIKGPDIRQKSFADMVKSLNSDNKIMPRYYLTSEEITAIYDYLQKKNEIYLSRVQKSNK